MAPLTSPSLRLVRHGASLVCLLYALHTSAAEAEWQSRLDTQHPLVGKIFRLDDSREISEDELYAAIRKHRFLLVGEKHDNPDHHHLEAKLLRQFSRRTDRPALVLEMLSDAQQKPLQTLQPGDTLAVIKAKLHWNENSWDFDGYGPLIQQAVAAGQQVVAGNPDKTLLMGLYREGESLLQGPRFSSVSKIDAPLREKIHQLVYQEHCGQIPADKLAPMVSIQIARDASMAAAMTQHASAALVAGAYHVLKDQGVPLHLQARQSKGNRAVVLLAEVRATATEPLGYASREQADFIWFTPRFTDRDYCEDLKSLHKGPARQETPAAAATPDKGNG